MATFVRRAEDAYYSRDREALLQLARQADRNVYLLRQAAAAFADLREICEELEAQLDEKPRRRRMRAVRRPRRR